MADARFRELRGEYEAAGRAAHYAEERWRRTAHARRTDRRERALVAAWLQRCAPLAAVLDLPCGAGRFHDLLAAAAPRVVAADAAAAMLRRHGGPLRLQASVHALPLREGAVDLALCSRLLHHFGASAERVRALKELRRVARRWAIVSHFDAASLQAWRARWRRRADGRHAQTVSDFRAEAAAAGWIERERAWILRGWSEQTWVLLEGARAT